jgi:hypothetical protein
MIEHGPNFIELPPDIIEGLPKWEVETIVGVQLFGRRKQKQYQVHWKQYSSAHDTWEPEDNIHTPKLIQQYHQAQGIAIRATRIRPRVSMFPASQTVPPGELPSTQPPSAQSYNNTPPILAERVSTLLTEYRLPRVAEQLEQIA